MRRGRKPVEFAAILFFRRLAAAEGLGRGGRACLFCGWAVRQEWRRDPVESVESAPACSASALGAGAVRG